MKYFSLFTGIGGLDSGISDWMDCAGYSEIKKSSIQIYQSHFPNHQNFGDITKINFKDVPDFDLLVGGFPCQSFSLAGLRGGFEDRRGKMIFYINDLLQAKKPEHVVLENVRGLLSHDNGRTFHSVVKLLWNAGYFVRVLMLNSLHYGLAQNRERVIFLGSRRDFDYKVPVIVDDTKRFRDVRETDSKNLKNLPKTAHTIEKINQKRLFNFELIGGYDRVGTLTTEFGCGEKAVDNGQGWFRYLSALECERLQGFPDGWTAGAKPAERYFALGNAVSKNVSDYLFKTYLPGLWWTKSQSKFNGKKEIQTAAA